jgi:VCBS repeat-containing protein
VNGLAVGQTYDLRFEAGAPFPNSAHLEVWFGGVMVGNIAPTGQMQEYEIALIGGSGDHSNLLEFRETGTPDNQGTYLANISVGEVVIDETAGIQPDSNEVAANTLFDTVAHHGSDPDMPLPQFAAGLTAVVSVAANFGADGPFGGSPVTGTSYSLTTNIVDSGLTTTAGQAIHLFNENGFVVGRYDSNNNGTIDGNDNAAFAFRVDPSTGVLSLVQYVSLHQPNTASNDEGVSLNTGALSVSVTVTDGDGDTATASADVSATIRFDDDGPTAVASATVAKAVDEDGLKPPDLSTGNADAGRTGEVTGTGSDTVSGNAGSLNSLVNFGADGPGAHPFQVVGQAAAITWVSGLHLSSQGSAIDNATVVGNTVTALAQDGRGVFSLAVNNDGSWAFKLLDQLDHSLVDNPATTQVHEIAFEDTLTLNLGGLIVATDGDGDPVTLNGSGLQISVLDDVPFFGTISSATVTHLNTVTTGTFDFHVGADDFPAGPHLGEFTVTPPTIAGVTVTPSTDSITGVITLTATFDNGGATFYVLTVNPNGTYTFALDSQAAGTTTTQTLTDVNLEHSFQPVSVKDFGPFSFIADPGSTVNGSGSGVGIGNDHVGNGEHLTIKFDNEMTVATFHLDPTGGDPILVTWVATDSTNPGHSETGTFTVPQNGPGVFSIDILAHDGGGNDISQFDTLSITPTSDQNNPGDHKGSGEIRFTSVGGTEVVQNANAGPFDFTLTGTDFDGDAATGTIHVVTDIHAPPVVSQNLVADEDDLATGNHDSAPGDEASVLAGHVSYNLGTDHIGSVALSTTGNLTDLQTLAGQAVDTFWNGSTLIGFVHGTDTSLAADQVFTITVTNTNDTGADYSMTLLQPVKHAIAGTEDNTAPFTVNVLVTDSTGATSSTSFTVVVNDDTPVAVASATVVKAVDEDGLQEPPDLSIGNADAGRTGEVTGTGLATVSGAAGSLNSLVSFGGDGPGAHPFQVVGQAAAITWVSGLHLSSQGSSIDNATVVGNTVTALAEDGRAVFSLTVNDDGSWAFKLLDQLDHPLVDNPATTQVHEIAFEDTLTLNLGGLIVATDGDGDPVTLNGSGLQISVLDDVPFFGTISSDTVTQLNTVTSGTFDFHVGADDFPAGVHHVGEFTVTPPTIAGVHVTPSTDPNTGVITLTATFDNGGATFYVLTVNPNGTYTFVLDGQPATTQALPDLVLDRNFTPEQTIDFGPFSFIADDGHKVAGGGGVGIDNDHIGNGEHLTIKFDQEMTTADFHLDQTGGEPVVVTWVATDSHNPAHTETGTFTVQHNESGTTDFTIDTGGVPFDTLSITPTSTKDNGDPGSGEIRFISVGGTEITPNVAPGPFDFTLTGKDFDGDAATGTIHIAANIQPAASASALDAMVSEAGLPPHGLLPAGSGEIADGLPNNNSDTSETATGTIMVTLGDTPSVVTIDNIAVTAVGQTIGGTFGTLTITSISTTQIGYSYTLNTNTSGDTTHDDFVVKVTDSDNATASATLVVNIVDDVPTAHADTNSVTEGALLTVNVASGVLVNDLPGADGFAAGGGVVGVASGSNTSSPVSGGVGIGIAGAHGTLNLHADGSYSYQSTANNITSNTTDTFVYTIKDGDGDLSTTTLTINLSNVTLVANNQTQTVNEAALDTTTTPPDLGNGTVTGSNPTATTETATGTLAVVGATGYTAQSVTGTHGLFHLNTDGTYVYTLTSPVTESPATNNGADTVNGVESFIYAAHDATNNTVTGTVTINVTDDVPSFGTISSATVTQLNTPTSGTFDFHVGADGFPAGPHLGEFTVTPPTIAGVDVATTTDPNTGVITLTATFDNGGATFYVLTVNPNGTYTFALDSQLPATTQTLADVTLSTNFTPAQTIDFGPFSFIADPGHKVAGGGGVGIDNDHIGNGEHLTIKFDQEMTVADFHLDQTGGDPVLVTWVATDSTTGHTETGTFTVQKNESGATDFTISAGGGISQFDTLSITPTSDKDHGDLQGSGAIRFISVGGTEITSGGSPGPFDFTLTGKDFDGDAATGTIHVAVASAIDPLILDLGTPGISLSTVDQGVQFDINGDGVKDQVAWTVGGQDGILALDLNGSGKIESGNELFTPTFNGGHFANGIAALASLDANHDGVIDAKDPAFSQLLVWQDANHNGVSDAGELTKLSDLGITSISLTTTPGTGSIDGQNVPAIGNFTYANGSQGSFVEANLDASLGTPSAQHHSHAHIGQGMPGADALKLPEGAAASIVADFHHGNGNIDLSSLGQPSADHHQHHEHHGQGGEHHLAAASMPMPAAIALMHEEAHRAAQAVAH